MNGTATYEYVMVCVLVLVISSYNSVVTSSPVTQWSERMLRG